MKRDGRQERESRIENRLFTVTFQRLGNAQILKMSLSPVASRIPVRYYANSRALTAFRKYWENVGWSFKGRLGCSTSSAKVPSRFSVSREHTARTCVCLRIYTLLKSHVYVPTTSARRDTRSRSRTVPKLATKAGVPPLSIERKIACHSYLPRCKVHRVVSHTF